MSGIFLSFVLIDEIGKSLCQSVVSPTAWDAELLGDIVVKGLKDMLQISMTPRLSCSQLISSTCTTS